MTKTEDDLMAAFAGESQANRKYLAYAIKADKEGFPQIARVFRAAAAAETVHALNHFRVSEGIKGTVENIKDAIAGEHYEFSSMYPEFLEDAKAEGHKKAEQSFHWANEVEKIHHQLYSDALDAVESGNDLPASEMFVCPVCGYTHEGEPPETCPVCNAKGSLFEKVE